MTHHLQLLGLLLCTPLVLGAQKASLDTALEEVNPKVIEWRRQIHQNPELSNREFQTAAMVADHLRSLGIEVQTGIAGTGVVGILKGKYPGKTLAIRADMDALPVTERNDLPFKSTVTALYQGDSIGVMHACGHDAHVAILMGVAEVLSRNNQFRGTVKFIFQPAEEGAPDGEEGGAKIMIREGVLENPKVDAIIGLHIASYLPVGKLAYRPGAAMAASQQFNILVTGKQTHGSAPWAGVDPIYISAKIIDGLQSLVSRESELTRAPVVLSFGKISSGVRNNIIPEKAALTGTLRTLDYDMQRKINQRLKEMVPALAAVYGAQAQVSISEGYPITYNDPKLASELLPSLEKAAGKDNVLLTEPTTGSEDFSFFQQSVPGLYFYLGGRPENTENTYFPHHTPDFKIDEEGFRLGVKAFTTIVYDFLK